jgi:NitT/TauT family transport system substrate-binding protein
MKMVVTRIVVAAVAVAVALAGAATARADGVVRLAIQKTGTVAWEIDVMREHKLDAKHGFELKLVELASTEGGKVAFNAGAADMMVSDWLYASRERGLGAKMQFVPYSATVGAVMVKADSPIKSLADLKGKKISVAGGALDKGWLLIQAAARRQGVDLRREASVVYGAPPLLFEKALSGETDATLNFWNFTARLETKGFRSLISVAEAAGAMGATGGVSMLGYVFEEDWAVKNPVAVQGFLRAARDAKQILATSDAEWDRIRPLTQAPDDAAFEAYKARYRDGIPKRTAAEEEADARKLYAVLAEIGGAELVGDGKALDPGTYYKAAPGL